MSLIQILLTSPRKRAIQVVALLLLIVFISSLFFRISFVSDISHGVITRISTFSTSVYRAFGRLTKSENALIVERDTYKQLAGDSAVDSVELEALRQEVLELEALLDYTKTIPFESIVSRIILRSEAGEQTILVDKGRVDGVQENFAAIVENGHMIGRVITVNKNTSKIVLLQSEESLVPSKIVGKSETNGLIVGVTGFLLDMQFIPQRIELHESDIVVTSGVEGLYPQGLVIGSVKNIHKDVSAAFQHADIQPFYDVNNFNTVMILNPFTDES